MESQPTVSHPRDELWTLYKTSVTERQLQAKLNWDRAKFSTLISAALLSFAVALEAHKSLAAAMALYTLTLIHSVAGLVSLLRGRQYSKAATVHLWTVEHALGLQISDPEPQAYGTAIQTNKLSLNCHHSLGLICHDKLRLIYRFYNCFLRHTLAAMSQSNRSLSVKLRSQVARLVGELGEVSARQRLTISRSTLERSLAGLPLRRGTLLLIATRLGGGA